MINLNFYAYQEAKDNYNKVSELIDILKNTVKIIKRFFLLLFFDQLQAN